MAVKDDMRDRLVKWGSTYLEHRLMEVGGVDMLPPVTVVKEIAEDIISVGLRAGRSMCICDVQPLPVITAFCSKCGGLLKMVPTEEKGKEDKEDEQPTS